MLRILIYGALFIEMLVVVSQAISQSFTDQTSLRPYDALSAWIGSLLELIDSSVF